MEPINKDNPIIATTDQLKNAAMLFSCDYSTAKEFGCEITWQAMNLVPEEWRDDCIIDSRVHMLKKGWLPAIPGWHLDDIPRDKQTGQPVVRRAKAKHMLVVIDTGSKAFTQYLKRETAKNWRTLIPCQVQDSHSKPLWGEVNSVINTLINRFPDEAHLHTDIVHSGIGYFFDERDYHRAMPAEHDGWRYFFRASIKSDRKVTNEIRRQTQIYMPHPEAGW